MAYGSREIAGGTTGSLANAFPAVDTISSRDYQLVKDIDPTEGSISPIGVAANPLKVQPRRRGTSDYDSGLVTVANGTPASVTGATIYPEGAWVSNPTTSTIVLVLTTAADVALMELTLAPKSTIELPIPRSGAWAGLKAGGSLSGLILQVSGAQ